VDQQDREEKTGATRRDVMVGAAALGVASALPSVAQAALSAGDAVEGLRDPILRISREVWQAAEVSLDELDSMNIHIRELRAAGFTIEGPGVSGVPTAFIAEWSQGEGGPKVGYLPEYDALPGLGNATEPSQTPTANGNTNGHGCGHNMLGAGCTGAGMALKAMMEANGTPGTVRIYGCAAEETQGAKAWFARDGRFNDLDAAIAWHPATAAAAGNMHLTAVRMAKLQFRGQTAHAGIEPWAGRSALDAAELATHAINMMREHVRPAARLHYIYEDGGLAPNVVPDTARVWVVVREADNTSVQALADWVLEAAEGAAQATQTESESFIFVGFAEVFPNEPLARRYLKYMNEEGLNWSEEEQEFARACQRAGGVAETGLATEVLPFIDEARIGGSSDVGDVCYNAPTALFVWPTYAQGFALHTWPVTAAGGMSIGDKASISTAKIMAATGFDVMTDADFRAEIRAEFDRRMEGKEYVSALPPEMTEPIDIPDRIRKTGQDEVDQAI